MENFKPIVLSIFFIMNCVSSQMISNGVSCDDIKIIINEHNKYRLQVASGQLEGQPPANNMQTMVWDNSLAQLAQSWADNMVFQHNRGRNSDSNSEYIGENIFQSWSSVDQQGFVWTDAIKSWFDEHMKYKYEPVDDSNFVETGHYTQVVWAKTKYVGCGATYFLKDGMYTKLYVCDYRIGGNMKTEYPYETNNSRAQNLLCEEQCAQMYGGSCSKK